MQLDDAPGPIGDAAIIAADRHQVIMADATFQSDEFVKGHGRKRLQLCFFCCESLRNDPLRCVVQAHVGNRRQTVVELGTLPMALKANM
jgi:hypothetical protein